MTDGPIGLFDTGLGGVAVLSRLRTAFPEEDFLCLADSKYLRYGDKSPQSVSRWSVRTAEHMAGLGIKALIVACNSAYIAGRHRFDGDFPLPITGPVHATAKKAYALSSNKRIGVTGTTLTVQSGVYAEVLSSFGADSKVFSEACPEWVQIVEYGGRSSKELSRALEDRLVPLLENAIDTLILGCTHFSLLTNPIQEIVGKGVRLVDSAMGIEDWLHEQFEQGTVQRARKNRKGTFSYLVTDDPCRFNDFAGKVLQESVETELISLNNF